MKRKYIISFSLIILFGLIFLTLSSIFNVKAFSDNDLNFTFERDILFNQDDTDYYKNFNTREFAEYEDTGDFEASFSFKGEVGKQGLDISFVDNMISGTPEYIEVVNLIDGHKDVLFINETSGTTEFLHNHTNTIGHLYGVNEFWVRMVETDEKWVYNLEDNDGNDLGLWKIDDGKFMEHFIGAWADVGTNAIDNTWYYIEFWWEYTSGGFKGLNEGQCNLRINGDDNFYTINDNNRYINRLTMKISVPAEVYIDGYGEWDIYYTGESFDIGTEDVNCYGITYYDDYFWITGTLNDKVHKYYLNGTYTGDYLDDIQSIKPWSIDYYDNYFWIVDGDTDTLYKYDLDGTYTDISYYLGAQGGVPSGITWFNDFFYTTDINQDKVFKYYSNGTYTGDYFSTAAQDLAMAGIVQYNNYFWITGYSNDGVYKYNLDGTYTGESFNTTAQDGQPLGIAQYNDYLWIIGADNNYVYKYDFNKTIYTLGDNLYSTEETSESGTEVDRWEFSHEGLFDRLDNGDDNPNGWTDLEDGEDDVNCRLKDDFDGVVELYANSGDGIGLYKDNLGYSNDILLNVSFGFEINYIYSVLNNQLYMKVYSSDNTEIVRIRIRDEGTLMYWTTGSTYVSLDTGFVIDTNYSINLSIDYETDKCILRYTTNGVYTDSFEFPLTATEKTGLKKVSFDVVADTDYCQVYLDYIGIYVDYRSITTDFGSIGLHISDHSYWYFTEYNLLTVDIIGDGISIYLDLADYVSTSPDFVHEVLISAKDYTSLEIINMYDYLYDDYWGYNYMWGGVLWFHFYDTFEFNEVNLEGVKLTEGVNEYSLEYESSGVEIVDNYFYVLDNKLYFTQTSNDTNLEYIQATFDINNLASGNRSVSYDAGLSGNSEGYFAIEYQDTTLTPLPLRTYVAAPNVILPQDKEVSAFIILITDNDKDSVQGITTGYITNIKLNYITDISLNIIISALFEIIVPLLILIIPTFLFYLRLGKAAIIPTFVLMAFICFITNIIPLWLFFIILISSGTFLVLDKTVLKDVKE